LLGTLAIRRGAVIECPVHMLPDDKTTNLLAVWGLGEDYQPRFDVEESDREAFLNPANNAWRIGSDINEVGVETFFGGYQAELRTQGIELIVPMIVRGDLTGLVLL